MGATVGRLAARNERDRQKPASLLFGDNYFLRDSISTQTAPKPTRIYTTASAAGTVPTTMRTTLRSRLRNTPTPMSPQLRAPTTVRTPATIPRKDLPNIGGRRKEVRLSMSLANSREPI